MGDINLKAALGGQITLTPTNTASNYTVTFPAATGTVALTTGGVLPVSQGGTGLSSLTAGYIPYGNGTGAFSNSANFLYNGILNLSGSDASIYLTGADGNQGLRFLFNGSDEGYLNATRLSTGSLQSLGLRGQDSVRLYTNGTERMRIASDGSVGIGISSLTLPAKVEIGYASGTEGLGLALTNTIAGGYGSGVSFYSIATDTTKLMAGQVGMLATGSWSNTANASSVMVFKTIGSGTLSEKMRITSGGLVGIGSTNPGYKLTIEDTTGNYYPVAMTSGSIGTAGNYVGMRFGYTGTTYQKAAIIFQSADTNGRGTLHFSLEGTANSSNADVSSSKMQLDYNGNLGLGVTPSAWYSTYKALQISANGSLVSNTDFYAIQNNAYTNGSANNIYLTTGYATKYVQIASNGQHQWHIAPSGSANAAITFTQAMTLEASGRLLLGNTYNYGNANCQVYGANQTIANAVGNIAVMTTDAYAIDKGGSISFGGKYASDGSYQTFGAISGRKENSGDGSWSGYLAFQTGPTATERMRIDSSGNLLVGTTGVGVGKTTIYSTTNTQAAIDGRITVAGDVGTRALYLSKYDNNSTTSQILVQFAMNNGNTGQGQINANGASAAAFGSYSDARLKENIVDLPSQLDNILALRPREFDYIESEGGGHQIGFIAQEMQQIYPDAVGERSDGMLTITAWSKTEARLVKAIQELAAKVAALEGVK